MSERGQRRAQFLAGASAALAESLDHERTLQRVAELAVPAIADWCTVAVRDEQQRLKRVAVVHRDPARAGTAQAYLHAYPPDQHRSGSQNLILEAARPRLQRFVSDEELVAAAQDERHLVLLRALGCTSCILVPMVVRGQSLGVISLMMSDSSRAFDEDDLALAEELAQRASVALENARLYREAGRREEEAAFLSQASALLADSLDYETALERVAKLAVPRFGDWCAVDLREGDSIRRVTIAHADPQKLRQADQLRPWHAVDLQSQGGVARVLRDGTAALFEEITD
jgi:GAF domain-containing protein